VAAARRAPGEWLWEAQTPAARAADAQRGCSRGIEEANHMPVGRQDLIKMVAAKANKSNKETAEFVNATLDSIKDTLEKGETVRLVGFGVFSVKDTAESVRVNPQTRQKITVPARKRVKFAAGKELQEAVAKVKTSAPSKGKK
jgi:DNA-binding protein HU-beta